MAHGGKRPGAGRKRGGANRKTREIADRAAQDGITPLEVMLAAMRAHHAEDRLDEAAAIAKDAAPYVHPRLGAVVVKDDGARPIYLVERIEIVHADADPEPAALPAPSAG